MATLQQLEQALVRADAAGDVDAARALAAAVLQARKQPQEPQEEQSFLQKVDRQVGLAARYGMEGIANTVQMVTEPVRQLITDPIARAVQPAPTMSELVTGREQAQGKPLGQIATEAADWMGLPKPQGDFENVVGAAARGVSGAVPFIGAGRAAAQAAGPITQAVGRGMAAQPGAQFASGAGGAGAAELVAQNDGGSGAQIAAALAGGVVAPMAMQGAQRVLQIAQTPVRQPQIVTDAARANVPLMTSDVAPPTTFIGKTARGAGEKVPIAGTGGMRAAQQTARAEAAKRFATEVGGDISALPDEAIASSLLQKRAGDIKKYTGLKQGVFDKLDGAGTVRVNNVVTKVDDEIARLSALQSKGFEPLVSKLDDFKTSIQGKTIKQVETLRKQLGEELSSDAFTSMKSEAEKVNRGVYGALKSDIEGFIKNNGDARDVTKWKVADKRLVEMIGELESSSFKRALDKGAVTPEVVRGMLFSKNKSDVQRLYKNLTPTGRDAARTAVIQEALVKSGGIDELSPQKFATQLEKMSNQTGIFLSKDQKAQADGLVRVLKATQRASEAAAAPPTGVQAVPFVAGSFLADILGGMGAATASAASVGGLARVYESAPVRNLLLMVAQTKPGTKQEAQIIRQILPMLQQVSEANEEQP